MNGKILSLVILIGMVAVLILVLIGWQTGFVVKDSDTGKGDLKMINENVDSSSNAREDAGVTGETTKTDSFVSHVGGESGSSSGGGSSSGSSNNNQNSAQHIIYLSLDSYSGNKNDELTINVKISTQEKIYASEFELSFNPEILQAINITAGNFLKQDGVDTYEIIKNENGKIIFASTRLASQDGVSGGGNLAIIKFLAKDKGTSQLTLDNVKVTDTSLDVNKFQVSVENGKITIT